MEEWVDILSANGCYTGKSCTKAEAHQKGLFHPTIHVWLYTPKQKIIIQKRSDTKINFPKLWDVSVAGHVEAGESIVNAALRETSEELGIQLLTSQLKPIFIYKNRHQHSPNYIDNEFNHVYIALIDCIPNQSQLQIEEVSQIKTISLLELKNIFNQTPQVFVPYSPDYQTQLFNVLENVCKV